MENVLTLILAGGTGDRLRPLTKYRAKPAVRFGGKYRIIDFALSNAVNSDFRKIYVLPQYESTSLNRHINRRWSPEYTRHGDFIETETPKKRFEGSDWYKGTADAIRTNDDLLKDDNYDHILLLSGDHIYKMNYKEILKKHNEKNARLTMSAIEADIADARYNFGVIEADSDGKVYGFEEKPEAPKSLKENKDKCLASMGIYMFDRDFLLEMIEMKGDDFGKHLIPQFIEKENIFAYNFTKENKIDEYIYIVDKDGIRYLDYQNESRDSKYWKDVGTIEAYYAASMDLIKIEPEFNLYAKRWPIRGADFKEDILPPYKINTGLTEASMICDGVIITDGTVRRSILSPQVHVAEDSLIEDSILFERVEVGRNTKIRNAIIDRDVQIGKGISIGYDPEEDKRRGFHLSDSGLVVIERQAKIR